MITVGYQNYSIISSVTNVKNQYWQCISDSASFNLGSHVKE